MSGHVLRLGSRTARRQVIQYLSELPSAEFESVLAKVMVQRVKTTFEDPAVKVMIDAKHAMIWGSPRGDISDVESVLSPEADSLEAQANETSLFSSGGWTRAPVSRAGGASGKASPLDEQFEKSNNPFAYEGEWPGTTTTAAASPLYDFPTLGP